MSFFIRKRGSGSSNRRGGSSSSLPKKLSQKVSNSGGGSRQDAAASGAGGGDGGGRMMMARGKSDGFRGRGRGGGGRGGLKRRFNHDEDDQKPSKKQQPQDEEITSEEDDEDEALQQNDQLDQDDDDDEETPQQARIRLAKEQIIELKKRLKKRKKRDGEEEEEDDDEETDVTAIGDLLREEQMIEEGKTLKKIMPEGYGGKGLDVSVLVKGGKVLKSPLTSISTATPLTTCCKMIYASTKSGHILSFNLSTSTKLTKQLVTKQPVTCITSSPKYLAASTPSEIVLLNPDSLETIKKLGGGSRNAIWLSIDRDNLYSCHRDRTVKVWDLGEGGGAYVESLFGHQDIPGYVDSHSYGNKRIVISTGGFDKTIRLWKVDEDTHLVYNTMGGEDILEPVRILGYGLFVVGGTTSGSLGLYTFGRKKVLDVVERAHGVDGAGVPRPITAIGGIGDFVASGSDDGVVKVWRVVVSNMKRRVMEFVRDVVVGDGVVVGISVDVNSSDGDSSVSMVIGVGTEMRNGRWGGRVSNFSRVVLVT